MEAVQGLVPVFFALAVGFAAGKFRIVDASHIGALNTVVMKIALPIALFSILAAADRSAVLSHGTVAGAVLAVMAITFAAVYFLQVRVWRNDSATAAIQALTVSFPNAAAVALPIAAAVLGATGELAVAVALAVGSLTVSPLTITIINRATAPGSQSKGGYGHPPLASSFGRALLTPVVVAPLLGVAWALLDIPYPALLDSTLSEVGDITGGLALIVTGLVLSKQSLRLTTDAVVSVLIANVARPLLAVAAVKVIGLEGPMASEIVLMLAIPSGFFGVLLGLSKGLNPPEPGRALFYSTVVSAVTLPVVITLLPLL